MENIPAYIQTAIIAGGALFAVYEYWRVRRLRPRIEFDIDFSLLPIKGHPDQYLVDIVMTIANKGSVRKYLPEIDVEVKSLVEGDVQKAISSCKRLNFSTSQPLIRSHNIIDDPGDPWWVDPGVTQTLRYPVVIVLESAFVQVNARFFYYRQQWRLKHLHHEKERLKRTRDELKKEPPENADRITIEREWRRFLRNKVDYHKATRIRRVET